MPYNPGVVDNSGQIRANYHVAGINSLVQGAKEGIAKWDANKEKEKSMQGIIKAAETMAKGFEVVGESIDPKLKAVFEGARDAVSNPSFSTTQRAAMAQSFLDRIPDLLKVGTDGMQMKAQIAQQQQMAAARQAEIAAKLDAERRKQAMESYARLMALGRTEEVPYDISPDDFNEASVMSAEIQKSGQRTERVSGPDGRPVERTYRVDGTFTDAPIQQLQRPVLSAKEEADKIDLTQDANAGWAMYNQVSSRVPTHYTTLEQVRNSRALIDSGVKQGAGAELILNTQNLVNTVFPGTFDTKNEQAAMRTYSDMAVTAAERLKGQGQVTENERKMIAETVAKFKNTPEGAKAIMDYMAAAAKREIALAEFVESEKEQGRPPRDGMRKKFLKENPLENYMEAAPQVTRVGRFELVK